MENIPDQFIDLLARDFGEGMDDEDETEPDDFTSATNDEE